MKRGRRKGGSKEKVFGCDLVEHLAATSQEIPLVLRSCCMFIEEHGIVDGIYRLSGVSSNTQKLRSEFDSEGSPDLYKDLYLQDIHCVSSLCKAYFRELPNPLLTYQLYDHFAEAVAVQLEDERMVKIKEVLKELPQPHYRTLEYLMKHLVRMATYSNQTNMHARNLAIVWAPNLLRSKDIEASGFNGTAAFMEVRVQSIVVEFILTHVSQLFPELDPEPGLTAERRKSLPSPCLLPSQEDHFFKALPFQYPGNMSPGDSPIAMRPYHAIIDGTEKRKGSLKGRKWKSIFNLGGRLQDHRKKKYAPKEKEKTTLRPAKSMDSLSSGPYMQEDSQNASPRISPLAIPSGNAEGGSTGGGGVASGYAVTYRRTGGASVSMVSGGGGAHGTYRSLDPGTAANTDKTQTPSQVMPSRAERRAGMHISGPFSVTVPLHITSGLALGVLQGGRAEEEELRQGQNEEEQLKKDKKDNAEEKETEPEEEKVQSSVKETESLNDNKEKMLDNVGEEDMEKVDKSEDIQPEEAIPEEQEVSEDKGEEEEYSSEKEVSNEWQDSTERTSDMDGEGYMVMKGVKMRYPERDGGQNESLNLPLQEEQNPDHELPLDFQDTFGFLDLMDLPTSYQINEFSVEPPAFDMEEDEEENNASPLQSHPHMETSPHTSRPLPNKSHSLPYTSYPFQTVLTFSSDEDCYSGPSDDDVDSSDSDKGEYEDMFIKSLPSEYHFQQLNWASPQIIMLDSNSNEDSQSKNQSECSDQTPTVSEDIEYCPPASQFADMEITDSNADNQCLNEGDLSPVNLETEHLNMGRKEDEDRSAENDVNYQSDSEKLGNVNEAIQEENEKTESTNSGDETLACSHTDTHSTDDENQEDTYFGPDIPSTTVEASNCVTVKTSCTTDPVTNEELPSSEDQNESTDNYAGIVESETILDEPSPELQRSQNKSETDKLSGKAEIILHTNLQIETDGNELEGIELSEEMEVGEKGEDERDARETETEEKTIIKEESTESEHIEGEKNFEGHTNLVDVDKMEKESDMVPQEEQIYLENKQEDVENVAVENQKEGSDRGKENDQQMEDDDIEEEIETKKDCHLEGDAEVKKGSVPEELSEEDDRLSEDGEERPREKGKESMKEEKNEDLFSSDREIPMRMKVRHGAGAGLGLGVGRTVIISKHKMYQVKAVPVVPPKPQHSKITAFRQQFQQRDADRQQKPIQSTNIRIQHTDKELPKKECENEIEDVAQNHDCQNTEQETGTGTDRETAEESKADQVKTQLNDTKSCRSLEVEVEQDRDEQKQRRGTWDGGSLRMDGQKDLDRESKRTSCISMCFDEAVARATGKRYREKESIEKEKFVELQ
ncbi:rho GTPase-activating protein 31 [Tachysurus fulvidraco]|uniref:rho GTPase-activating protein 31 n=1 Tax=Tachysurus fulvidraco TaxID=1234273 RepID=UPI001FEE8E4E|nr:rho GTPase-activating protein 31 [Tachysurus fulvidraco]